MKGEHGGLLETVLLSGRPEEDNLLVSSCVTATDAGVEFGIMGLLFPPAEVVLPPWMGPGNLLPSPSTPVPPAEAPSATLLESVIALLCSDSSSLEGVGGPLGELAPPTNPGGPVDLL